MPRTTHYFEPAHMTKTSSGNVGPCCAKPEAEHPPFVDGAMVTVVLAKRVRGLKGTTFRAGTRLRAERASYEVLAEVRPSRWGTNVLGQFAELDKGEYTMVRTPGYSVELDGYRTALAVRSVREV